MQCEELKTTQIVWFKRDLRVQDHAPLTHAVQSVKSHNQSGVLCLFIHEPSHFKEPGFALQHSAFLRECLDDLRQQLQALGGDLIEVVGEAVDEFEKLRVLLATNGSKLEIFSHQETTSLRDFNRDVSVNLWCKKHGVKHREFGQNAVLRGSANRTSCDNAFESHMQAACQQPLISLHRLECVKAWSSISWLSACVEEIPQGAGVDKPGRIRGGRSVALARLEMFAQFDHLAAYPKSISTPMDAQDGCSRLSPHLSMGTLSDREVLRAVNDAANSADEKLSPTRAQWVQKASAFFAQRVYWRSGYLQMMETHPELENGGDVLPLMGLREPHFDIERFDRWANGTTGFPMVDASMRMLHEVGWVNMRMRGMLASFALNELWLSPKEVGQHLASLFLDFEPAIHWGQIYIHAGLLHGSRPLVYNPVKQAQDQDPQGRFVRTWLPELADVPIEHIIEPWKMTATDQDRAHCKIGSGPGFDYPWPIVDSKSAAKCAKDRVYAVREGKQDPGGLPFECAMIYSVKPARPSSGQLF